MPGAILQAIPTGKICRALQVKGLVFFLFLLYNLHKRFYISSTHRKYKRYKRTHGKRTTNARRAIPSNRRADHDRRGKRSPQSL